jgi:hypothetical protein
MSGAMFETVTMLDYRRPLAERLKARKSCGPYTWRPRDAKADGIGFYCASKCGAGHDLEMDSRGSVCRLRLQWANDALPRGSRLARINGYYCDEFQDSTMTPIVALLPHGRGFLAGWTMGSGMAASLCTSYIWETIEEAAVAAHDEAERAADREREFQERESARLDEEEE